MWLYRGIIIAKLLFMLGEYCKKNPIGRALAKADYNVEYDDLFLQTPSLSVIPKDKPLINEGAAPYMPDLAIEVQSPDQSDKLMVDKAAYYLAHGTRMVWLVYPEQRIVEVLTPTDRQLLNENATLTGGDVLPGFTLTMREIFAE